MLSRLINQYVRGHTLCAFVYTDCTKKKTLVVHALEIPDVDAYFFCVVQDGVSFGLGYL